MFIAALFIVAQTLKQVKCPLVDDWRKMMWYIHTIYYYSSIRKDEILPLRKTWMDCENSMLRKINQSEK